MSVAGPIFADGSLTSAQLNDRSPTPLGRLLSFTWLNADVLQKSHPAGSQANALAVGASAQFPVFTFRLNPNNLRINRKKIEKYILTKAGYERQFWQNDLAYFSYSGSTGQFRPSRQFVFNPSFTSNGFASPGMGLAFDIRDTERWQNFNAFEGFYQQLAENNVLMSFWAYPFFAWEGSLDDFDYTYSNEDPYQIKYQFKFTGLPILYINSQFQFQNSVAGTDVVVPPVTAID